MCTRGEIHDIGKAIVDKNIMNIIEENGRNTCKGSWRCGNPIFKKYGKLEKIGNIGE